MTGYMQIMVRVISSRAQAQLAALQAQQKGLNATMMAGNRIAPMGTRHIVGLQKFGNQLQWTGRMIQYNFTLPILAAGVAATTWAMQQEKALTHVSKVYGDLGDAADYFVKKSHGMMTETQAQAKATEVFTAELAALDEAFTAISNHYGVAKTEVLEVAGAWAAAGQSGRDLAESVNLTMKAIIIGDMNATKATESLLAVQAQYNLSTAELNKTLEELNSIENATAISMAGLIDGFSRSAGMARQAGIDTQHLGAMLAALVPASGSAANAGNALKTIISRILGPTKEATQVMNEMGLNTTALGWNSMTATERLHSMSDEFLALGAAQQNAAAATIASRWQINRFAILMKALNDENGAYVRALKASEDQGYNYIRMQKELNAVLESDPRRMQRMWVMLQNAMADVIQPLIPHIIYLAQEIGQLAQAFADLDPHTQKIVLWALVFLALVGPLVRYMGALTTLFWVFGITLIKVGRFVGIFARTMVLANGTMLVARKGVIQFLASLIVGPIKFFGTMIFGVFGAISSFILATMGKIVAFMAASMARIVAISTVGWMLQLNIWRSALGAKFLMARIFWMKIQLLWVAATLGTASRHAAMWAMIKATTVAGWAFLLSKWALGAGLVAMTKTLGMALIVSWRNTWAAIKVFSAIGWITMQAQWTLMTLGWATFGGIMAAITRSWTVAISVIQLTWSVSIGAMWAALRVMILTYWIEMWAAIRVAQTLQQAGIITRTAAFWAIQKAIWMAGALATAAISGVMWRSLKAIWMVGALTIAGIAGALWRTITGGAALMAVGFQRTMVGMLAVTKGVFSTMLLVTTAIWRGMAMAVLSSSKVMLLASTQIFRQIARVVVAAATVAFGPWGLVIMAVLGVIYYFRDQIKQIFQNIMAYFGQQGVSLQTIFHGAIEGVLKAFNALPQGVQNAMVAVVTIVHDAAMAVYEWFQYINPFARHSPSLVDNVTNGVARINNEFSKFSKIKGYVSAAYAEVKRFNRLTAQMGISADKFKQQEDRATIKNAGGGAALASYNKLTRLLNKLTPVLAKLEQKMVDQQRVVDVWQAAVDKANKRLDVQQSKLDKLQSVLDKYQGKLDAANDSMSYYASAPLKGMQAMNDQIHANEMAQKKLRLEIMRFEDANGTYDEMKSKIEAINGAQEVMRGAQAGLRSAGAGSEILGQYDKEIGKLDDQRNVYAKNIETLADMNDALDKLGRKGEELDLVKALKFDDLQYQIEKMTNTAEELTFDQIRDGIMAARAEIAKWGPKVDEATAAVAAQQAVVDKLTVARDQLQLRLDKEEETLARIKAKYDEVNGAIQAIKDSIDNVLEASSKLDEAAKKKKGSEGYVSPGLEAFRNAGKGDFPDPGGKGIPPRTDWSSQVGDIEDFTKEMAFSTSDLFAAMNPFAPFKDKAVQAWEWIKDKAKMVYGELKEFFSAAFEGVGPGDGFDFSMITDAFETVRKALTPAFEFITGMVKDILKIFRWLWELVGDDVIEFGKEFWNGLKDAWNQIKPVLEGFREPLSKIGEAFSNLWRILKPVLAIIAGILLFLVKLVTSVLANVIRPILGAIGGVIAGILSVIKGFIKVVVGIFTLDLGMVLGGLGDIFWGVFKTLWSVLVGVGKAIFGIVEGLVKGVFKFFVWLWDKLFGHSVIVDIIEGFWFWFGKLIDLGKWLWNKVVKPIIAFVKAAWPLIKDELQAWWGRFTTTLRNLWGIAKWIWDHVLKPIWDFLVALWKDYVRPELADWWSRIKNTWDKLKDAGGWIKDHVMDPVVKAFKDGWAKVKEFFQDTKLLDPLKGMVNGVVTAINWIIKGINQLDHLPGVSIDIKTLEMPFKLAAGGPIPNRRVAGGFKTNGARAIVGEGKANYPEFVIPTDPTYRKRAKTLMSMAASKLGMGEGRSVRIGPGGEAHDIAKVVKANPRGLVPKFGIGGFLGDVGGAMGGALDFGQDVAGAILDGGRNVFGTTMGPFMDLARGAANKIDWSVARDAAKGGIDITEAWIKGASSAYKAEYEQLEETYGTKNVRGALKWARSQVGKPYTWGGMGVGTDGYDCSGFMSAITQVLRGGNPHSRVGTTATFPWPGFNTMGPYNPKAFVIGSTKSYAGGVGHMAGTLGGVNVESAGGVGVRVGSAARGYMDSGFTTRAQMMAAANGAVVRSKVGGVNMLLGEGGRDEAVLPLPRNWKSPFNPGSGGGDTYHFYGDLEFPNVETGEDAEDFLTNLKNLAKD